MNYKEIIQSAGKELQKRVYYKNGNTKTYYDDEHFKSVKLAFNNSLFDGTICKYMELEMTEKLNTTYPIYVEITATLGEYSATETYGPYYLQKGSEIYNASSKTYTHSLYDGMILTMIKYEPVNVTYPTTVDTFFSAVIGALNLSQGVYLNIVGSKVLQNDPYYGIDDNGNPKSIGYTYRDVLSDILQADGKLGIISGNYLTSITLGTTEITINDDLLKNQNIDIDNYFYPINCLTLSRSNGLDNLTKQNPSSISYYGKHEIIIKDNQLLNDSDRENYIDDLFDVFRNKGWYFYDLELTGYGGFQPLDRIKINTNGTNYYSYVFNNEITIDEGYKEVIYANMEDQPIIEGNYNYTSSEEKSDKNAEIIINKRIGEVDIRGKAIKLTTDDITIESNNFNVDTDGNLLCNEATMRGATFTGGDVTLYEDTSINNHTPLKIYENDIIQTLTVNDSYSLYRVKINLPSSGYLSSSENLGLTPFLKFENNDFEIQYRYSHNNNVEWLDEVRLNKNTNEVQYIDLWYRDADEIKVAPQPTIIDATMTCTLYSNSYTGLLDRLTYVLTTTSGTTKLSANRIYTRDIISYNDNYYFHSLPNSGVINTNMMINVTDNQNSIHISATDITNNNKSVINKSTITLGLTSNKTISGNAQTPINLDTRVAYTGQVFSKTNDGGVKVGAGVSAVIVSAQAVISAYSGNATRRILIKRNRNGTISDICRCSLFAHSTYTGTYFTMQITPKVMGVQENDIIYLYSHNNNPSGSTSSTTLYGSSLDTYLTVQEIE